VDRLKDRLERVRGRIDQACARCGRPPNGVRFVAISKGFPAEAVSEAMALGVAEFGENRVQEASEKIPKVEPRPRWHLVGHLQTNKAKRAVELFDAIQSVDSIRIAEELDRRAAAASRILECLVEVNTSGDPSKYGAGPEATMGLLDQMRVFKSLRVGGLMTIGPLRGGAAGARTSFRALHALRAEAVRAGHLGGGADLSMGMSDDFEIAVEEGATIVRLGTALFGARPDGQGPGGTAPGASGHA